MRMIQNVKKNKAEDQVQILLFSATFDDTIKEYAHKIVGGKANQVSFHLCNMHSALKFDMQLMLSAWESCPACAESVTSP